MVSSRGIFFFFLTDEMFGLISVEWSTDPDFKDIVGSQEILNSRQHDLEISNLIHRQRYYFRAACGNIRGYSLPKVSTPTHVEPSSKCIESFRFHR
jgi:Phosphodiesterase/alkaline phosphatase D